MIPIEDTIEPPEKERLRTDAIAASNFERGVSLSHPQHSATTMGISSSNVGMGMASEPAPNASFADRKLEIHSTKRPYVKRFKATTVVMGMEMEMGMATVLVTQYRKLWGLDLHKVGTSFNWFGRLHMRLYR